MQGNEKSLEINVMSAEDLKDVNLVTTMDVYVEVSINGDHQQRTSVIKGCGPNPIWNSILTFPIDLDAHQNYLLFHLKSDRKLGDRDIGKVEVNINELFNSNNGNEIVERFVISNGKSRGVLKFSYKFGEIPATSHAGSSSGHPPPPGDKKKRRKSDVIKKFGKGLLSAAILAGPCADENEDEDDV